MKLRIGNNGNGKYWVEQKWCGLFWRRCNELARYEVNYFRRNRSIRWDRDAYFMSYEKAQEYAIVWWQAFSHQGRKWYKKHKQHSKNEYTELDAQRVLIMSLLKEKSNVDIVNELLRLGQ